MARLERLIYGSTATGSTENLTNVATILAESQRNNERDDLTGALAAHQGRYLQVIEGPADRLDGLLQRLQADPRHRDITVFDRHPVGERLFAGWTMASARITPALGAALERLLHDPAADPGRAVTILREASQPA